MANFYIIRGLPGTGKTTLGNTLAGPEATFAADDYFYDENGVYNFDPSQLGKAHAQCQLNVKNALVNGKSAIENGIIESFSVAVANTFSCRWEFQPYLDMAKEIGGIRVFLIDLFDNETPIEELFERNVHGVPRHVFANMYDRWER